MELKIEGKLMLILESESGVGKNGEWTKQPFVIEVDGQYPKKINFLAWGKVAGAIEKTPLGSIIEVNFDPASKEHNGNWYTQLTAYKFEVKQRAQQEKSGRNTSQDQYDTSDLPF